MAGSSSEKTEAATPKKLREARKKGQVPHSQDVPSVMILLLISIFFVAMGEWFFTRLADLYGAFPALINLDFGQAIGKSIDIVLNGAIFTLLAPIIALSAAGAILGNIVQFGVLFSIEPVIPKMSKISPANNIKKVISLKQVITTSISLVKVLFISVALYIVIRAALPELMTEVNQCDLLCKQSLIGDLFTKLMMIVIPLMVVLAILDFAFQKHQFAEDQKMTKEEVKREHKDMYGDPHLKGELKSQRRELVEQDIQSRIRDAKLVVIDIGIAISLRYEKDETPLPIITAIGKASMARKMVEIAGIENIPMVSDPGLAGDLLKDGKVDQYIPMSTIDRVAHAMRRSVKR